LTYKYVKEHFAVKNSRGRPARTSREDILDAACAQLKENPFEELSLSALARSMALTPMALYRYFADKNDLQQAIAERLMTAIVIDFDGCTNWQMKIRQWSWGLWHGFHENPQLIRYMGWQGHVASAWLRQVALLVSALKDAGFDSRELALASRWVSVSVVGIIQVAIGRAQLQVQLGREDVQLSTTLANTVVAPMLADLANTSDEALFEHHVMNMIAGLETSLKQLPN
jgi:AcrR family transcriptional regulator